MVREREDVRKALELLLTPKQFDYIMSWRGRSRLQTIRLIVQEGLRYRLATQLDRDRWLQHMREYLEEHADEIEGEPLVDVLNESLE
jgi:hypothetical protein